MSYDRLVRDDEGREVLHVAGPSRSLPENLWEAEGPAGRSRELTPLYVARFEGERHLARPTIHDHWELLHVRSGTGTLEAGETWPLRTGTTVFLPPGQSHREESPRRIELLWVGLVGGRLEGLDTARVHVAYDPSLRALFETLWLQAERWRGGAGAELDGLAQALFGRFLQAASEAPVPAADLIDDTINLLHRQFGRPWTVADLARRAGYSVGYFHRAFRKRTGASPVAYLTEIRLQQALHWLINTNLPVKRVAREAGYSDPLYFSRLFRKRFGHSPSRRRLRGKGDGGIEPDSRVAE